MVAQVNFVFFKLPVMEPFRHLLSTKMPFAWSGDLEEAFKSSREAIIRECENVVRNFNTMLLTYLTIDWGRVLTLPDAVELANLIHLVPGCCGVVVSTPAWKAGDVGSIPVGAPTKFSISGFRGGNL